MRFIDAATTRRHLEFAALIEALRALFVAGCEVPPRQVHRIGSAAGGAGGSLLLMPAWRAGRRLGVKTVTVFPGNAALGKPALHSSYLLFDATTGEPLAQIDGDEITSRRTAAASALAASFLARGDAARLLVVGAGRVASLMRRRSEPSGRSPKLTCGRATPPPPRRWRCGCAATASRRRRSTTWKPGYTAPTSSAARRSPPCR